jgi:choline dehydrogenase-like flavoprotein
MPWREVRRSSQPEYDICLIGAGAAGLTLAAEFLQGDPELRVAVLDGNGLDDPVCSEPLPGSDRAAVGKMYACATSSNQFLYVGQLRGWLAESRPDYLTASRLRALGGTSVIWSGWWLPLEPHDMGCWPISYTDLVPYYRRVHESLALGPYRQDAEQIVPAGAARPAQGLPLPETGLITRAVLVKRVNFWDLHARAISASCRVHLYRNANFQSFETSADGAGRRIEAVRACSVEGGKPVWSATISARAFVLAAGALENTRILLISQLGDGGGHLGRHFCEHPYLWVAARLDLAPQTVRSYPLYFAPRPLPIGWGTGAIGVLVPRPALMREYGISSFRALLGGADGVPGTISLCWEQTPVPGGAIEIGGEPTDALGLPPLRLSAEVSETDRRTPITAISLLTAALSDRRLAWPTELPPLDRDPWQWRRPGHVVPGNHPMGTTRMSARPEDGVVDPHCRVHGTTNLYVAGSCVFPSGGHANPTLTILALASRLADHLKGLPVTGARA